MRAHVGSLCTRHLCIMVWGRGTPQLTRLFRVCVVISVVGLLVCECPCIPSYLQCVILFVSITLILAVLHDDML